MDYIAYVNIANKQKVIDIEKVCKWLYNNYGHFDGTIEDLVTDIRKTFEEI